MILGDDSAAMNELSSEMHEMVEFAAQSEDADLVLDLRVMGNNKIQCSLIRINWVKYERNPYSNALVIYRASCETALNWQG